MRKHLLLLFLLLSISGILKAQPTDHRNFPDSLNRKKLIPIIATEGALYLGSMAYLQYVWYKDTPRAPFHFYNDNQGYLQVDKFGHMFGSYLESYLGYHWLRHAGVKKKHALLYGATLGIVLQTPIEVWDGLYEGWGFSKGDMVANSLGSALVISQELLFDDQPVKMKFSFSPSPYYKQANGYLGETAFQSLFYDYNGHTYWFSGNINRLILKEKLPDWLNLAVGYSANGMFGEFKNRYSYRGVVLPETRRYRQFLIAPDIDWTRIQTNHRFLNKVLKGMFFIKLPTPALEFNSTGKFKGYWLYF